MQLTEKQQWYVTIALELENAGYFSAVAFLRAKIPDINWKEPVTHTNPENILRAHHGSNPPLNG